MFTPERYAAFARLAALVIGSGSLAWSASDAERIRVLIGTCEGRYVVCPPGAQAPCRSGVSWNGCETLARELLVSGSLLIVAGVPIVRRDRR